MNIRTSSLIVFLAVGVENSCEIKASAMDPATLKLNDLADIVIKLMSKSPYEWPAKIEELPDQLKRLPLGELLQVTFNDLLFITFETNLPDANF